MRLDVMMNGQTVPVGELPPGDAGIAATIAGMQAVVDHAVYHEVSGPRLAKIARHCAGETVSIKDFARALDEWCREHVVFQRDPERVELIRHPLELLDAIEQTGSAHVDCDDLAVLGCAIIAAGGHAPVLVTVGRKKPGRFEHVFFGLRRGGVRNPYPFSPANVYALVPANIYPLDPQEGTAPGQWPDVQRVRLWGLRVTDPRVRG